MAIHDIPFQIRGATEPAIPGSEEVEGLDAELTRLDQVLVNAPASADTINKLIVENGQAYTTVVRVVHQATANQATFENIRFDLGYFSDESALNPTFYVVGRYYYNFAEYTPRVVRYISGNSGPKEWADANAADLVANITGDVGHFASDDEALPHITQVGDVYFNERLRTYRRANTFTAGSVAERSPQRLRQANAEDLGRIDSELEAIAVNRLEALVTVSPAAIDINNPPPSIEINVTSETNRWTADGVRVVVLGANRVFPFNPQQKIHAISLPFTPQMLANARLAVQDRNPTQKTTLTIGIQQANVEVASANFTMSVGASPIGDLQQITSDLRLVFPPLWETATGMGVGLNLAPSLVGDVSTLTFTPMVTIPADAEAGDDYILYMSVPTEGLNLSDWRVDLAGFAYYTGFSFGAVGTVGDNTVLSFLMTVGNGSGGFASGTAPGALLTLQHHGTTPHTAYSGDLEGRALAQVEALVGTGGGGSVTAAQLATERAARVAGDMLTFVEIGNAAGLTSVLNSQATSAESFEGIFTAEVVSGSDTYARGQVIYIGPGSRAIERKFIVPLDIVDRIARNQLKDINSYLGNPDDTAPFRIYQANEQPGILSVADLDGDYLLVFKTPADLLSGAIAGAPERIDELRIFITNGGLSQTVHRVDPWTYAATPVVIPFNISDAEESSVAASITGNAVEFTVRAFLSNGAVGSSLTYNMPISPAFRAPQTGGGQPALTLPEQIGLVRFSPRTPTFNYRGSVDFIRTFSVDVDGAENITGDVWYQRFVGASAVPGPRIKWSSTTAVIDFPSTTAASGSLLNDQRYPLDLRFYDAATGGNEVEIIRIDMGISSVSYAYAITSEANILFDVDSSAQGIITAGSLNLAHDATLNLGGGRDGSETTIRITQTPKPRGGWVLTLHSSIMLYGGIVPPVLKTDDGAVDLLRFRRIGAVWYYMGMDPPPASGGGGGGGSARSFGSGAGQIATWAEGNNAAALPDSKIPTSIARQSALAGKADNFTVSRDFALTGARELQLSAAVRTTLAELVGTTVILEDTDPANPLAASAATLGKLLHRGDKLYYTFPIHYTARVVAWRDFATADLPQGQGFTWGGARQVTGGGARGTIIYSIPGNRFERRGTFGGSLVWGPYNLPNWLGAKGSEAEADASATAVGQVAFFDGRVQIVVSITAAEPDEFEWRLYEYDLIERIVALETATIPQLQSQVLTYAADMSMDVGAGYVGLVSLTGNTVFQITGGRSGDVADLLVTQDGTGSRTLTLHSSVSRYHGVPVPTLTTDANAIDSLLFRLVGATWYFVGQRRVA